MREAGFLVFASREATTRNDPKVLPHISGMGSRTRHTTQTKGQPPGKGRRNANVVALVKYLARYAAERDDKASRKKRSSSNRRKGVNKDSHQGDTK